MSCKEIAFKNTSEVILKITKLIKDLETHNNLNGQLASEDEQLLVYLANNNSYYNHNLLMFLTSWEMNKERVRKRQYEELEDKE